MSEESSRFLNLHKFALNKLLEKYSGKNKEELVNACLKLTLEDVDPTNFIPMDLHYIRMTIAFFKQNLDKLQVDEPDYKHCLSMIKYHEDRLGPVVEYIRAKNTATASDPNTPPPSCHAVSQRVPQQVQPVEELQQPQPLYYYRQYARQ